MKIASHFACNIPVCHNCAKKDGIVQPTCPHDPQGLSLVHHAETDDCPLNKFPPPNDACTTIEDRQYVESAFRKLWRRIHRRPLEYADAASELVELQKIIAELPCGGCRNGAATYLQENPPDFTSPRALHLYLVTWHNSVSRKLNKPPMTPAHAARVHGLTALMTPEELAADTAPVRLLIWIAWSLGDEIVLGAGIQAINVMYPGEYQISLDCRFPQVFENLNCSTTPDPAPELIHTFKIHRGLPTDRHFVAGTYHDLAQTINRPLRGPVKPYLKLSAEEKELPPIVEGPYWVMAAGGKIDATTKIISAKQLQGVVDHYQGTIKFVQVGGTGREHIEQHLIGTIDLTGKTTVRELIRLIGADNCRGVISGITGVMHVGAAFNKPLVVVAGAREDDTVARYDNSEWIRTSPPCQNCWILRVQAWPDMGIEGEDPYPGRDNLLCRRPDSTGKFASCLTDISVQRIVQGIDRFPRPKMALCTFYTVDNFPIAKRVVATQQKYAKKWGYDFICPTNRLNTDRAFRWQKPEILLANLGRYTYMCWLDGLDVVITNPKFDLVSFIEQQTPADLYITNDMNGLNNGVMIWRNTLASFKFLQLWKDAWERHTCDQVKLKQVLRDNPIGLEINYLPQQSINSYFWQWSEGDWVCHFVGGKGKVSAPLIRAFLQEFETA